MWRSRQRCEWMSSQRTSEAKEGPAWNLGEQHAGGSYAWETDHGARCWTKTKRGGLDVAVDLSARVCISCPKPELEVSRLWRPFARTPTRVRQCRVGMSTLLSAYGCPPAADVPRSRKLTLIPVGNFRPALFSPPPVVASRTRPLPSLRHVWYLQSPSRRRA